MPRAGETKVNGHVIIEAYSATRSIWKTGELVGLCGQTVWKRLNKLGIKSHKRYWTEEELARLNDLYGGHKETPIDLTAFAKSMGRDIGNISKKAHQLGLIRPNRIKTERMRQEIGRRVKLGWQEGRYPVGKESVLWRGGKQIRICPVCGRFFEVFPKSKAKFCSWRCKLFRPQSQGKQGYAKSGKRTDLNGQYFRSRWEANYARYLNLLITQKQGIVKWEYEIDTFEFKRIKRGTRFYTPDFKVFLADGTYEYHEVKGWEHPEGQTAIKRFRKYYPQFNLIIIGRDWFSQAKRQGLDALIENWEHGCL